MMSWKGLLLTLALCLAYQNVYASEKGSCDKALQSPSAENPGTSSSGLDISDNSLKFVYRELIGMSRGGNVDPEKFILKILDVDLMHPERQSELLDVVEMFVVWSEAMGQLNDRDPDSYMYEAAKYLKVYVRLDDRLRRVIIDVAAITVASERDRVKSFYQILRQVFWP